jgi:hypothetical protein
VIALVGATARLQTSQMVQQTQPRAESPTEELMFATGDRVPVLFDCG